MIENKPIVHLSRDDWELLFKPILNPQTPLTTEQENWMDWFISDCSLWSETQDGVFCNEFRKDALRYVVSNRQYPPDVLIVAYNTYDFDLLASDTETVLNRSTYGNYSIAEIIEEARDYARGRCEEIIVTEINGTLEDFIVEPPEDCGYDQTP